MNKIANEALSEFVRRIMDERGLTLHDVEVRSGGEITDAYVSRVINKQAANLTTEKLRALARGLHVDAVGLFRIACGAGHGTNAHSRRRDPSHALDLLRLMQTVVVNPNLTDILEELVRLSPKQQRLVLGFIRKLSGPRRKPKAAGKGA